MQTSLYGLIGGHSYEGGSISLVLRAQEVAARRIKLPILLACLICWLECAKVVLEQNLQRGRGIRPFKKMANSITARFYQGSIVSGQAIADEWHPSLSRFNRKLAHQ
jgi:hypothetical protein